MGIQYSQASEYVKELQKWEIRPVLVGETYIVPLPGTPPYVPEEHPFPKMLYKAISLKQPYNLENFKCLVVKDEAEEGLQVGQGWAVSQEAALELARREQTDVATVAANRAYHERRMSPKAQAEAQAVVEQHAVHLGEIPRTPVKRRVSRKAK